MNSKIYKMDETEKIVRKRALENLIKFEHVYGFDVYNAGYVQAMEDMGIDKKYITIFKRVCVKIRESFKAVKASYAY
jgi:hypothetical protein